MELRDLGVELRGDEKVWGTQNFCSFFQACSI